MAAGRGSAVRWTVITTALAAIVLSGCSSSPNATATPTGSTTVAAPPTSEPSSPPGTMSTSSSVIDQTTPAPSAELTTSDTPATPASYVPPPDGDPVDGDCPFLTGQQAADDTGQRIGSIRIIPGDPQPVCLFTRSDGGDLATVRALTFASAAEAAQAVDHYLPRDQSNVETKPDGWSGGSMRTDDDGSVYGVSKDGYAVIATSNVMTVAARRLVVDAIANLGW